MYRIIIERSKEQMQVVAFFSPVIGKDFVEQYMNKLEEREKVTDPDILEFKNIEDLNDFLLSELKN